MKNILLVLFLSTFGQEKDLKGNTNLRKDTIDNKLEFILEKDIFLDRDNNFCVTTDKILKYQVKDILDRYYVLSKDDIMNFTDSQYSLFKKNYKITAVLLEDYIE